MSLPSIRASEVRVLGRKVRVLRAGEGPAIVLVHGLGLGADVWRYHLERLGAAGLDVVAPDMPGFGRSRGPAFGFTVEHAASWLAAFADASDIRRAVWVGHSVSAQYVLRLAASHTDLVAGLVLAGPTGEPGRMRWLAQLTGLARTAFRERRSLVARVAAHYLTTLPTRTIGSWLAARRHPALADAGRVRCPVRVVLGARDPVVPRAFADQLVALAPAAELVVLEESAHGVALSPAEPFCAVVLDFLARVFPQPPVENPSNTGGKAVETT